MSHDFLVELGTEELPPGRLRAFTADFHARVVQALVDAQLIDADTHSTWFCSPRRMAVRVADVREHEPNQVKDRLGPAVKAAFDADGKPTKAAEGFARSCGTTVEQLEHRDTDKGVRLAFEQHIEGRSAATVLAQAVTDAVGGMSIPRRMRWGDGDTGFIRPLHWLVMLHGNEVVDCELFGIRSGNQTRGHRFHYNQAMTLHSPADYDTTLFDDGFVAVDDADGRLGERVQMLAREAAAQHGASALESADLSTEIAALVEWPVAVVGQFSKDFLRLPAEVISAVLEGQQRYYPVFDENGALKPLFVAISNIESKQPEAVRAGNEKVILPRLSDAAFFWNNDRKTPLADRADALASVVFQRGLGTLADKSDRIRALATAVAEQTGANGQHAARAGSLCKCDLTTEMVGEFAKLQGIMGEHYARADGEPGDVPDAIGEHYLPLHASDAIPATTVGQAVAVADKLDTIAGAFALGKKPSGAKDPFALRRAATGIVRIGLEGAPGLSLKPLIDQAVAAQPVKDKADTLAADILEFIHERLRYHYQQHGYRNDVVDSVLALGLDEPIDIDARITALNDFVDQPAARALAAANKRSANILKKSDATQASTLDATQLNEAAEVALGRAIEAQQADVTQLVNARRYGDALTKLATLREPVDAFFDEVMVNAEDPAVRANRLALLANLQALFLQTADWARIQVET